MSVPLPHPELRLFVDRVIVPALLERFLREHASPIVTETATVESSDLPKTEATV